MDFEYINIWCWIIPLLVGIICGVLGYLIGKDNKTVGDNSSELKLLKDKNSKLEADLNKCLSKKEPKAKASITPTPIENFAFNAGAAKTAFGKTIKQNDLKLVEGIGPKIEQLFHTFDIKTWQALSEVSVAKCREVLKSGGDRYKIHDPASWPMQAKMAYEGKWKDLDKWQKEHKAGRL